jgi:PAS domain S-box-containing protein
MTFIFKYEYYKKKFYNEIMIDLDLTEKFWKFFSKKENKSIIDFNKMFKLSEKIMISKLNVEQLWKKLFSLYTGINEVFNFYCEYIEEINDDSFLKRELESIKRKNETSSDSINQNFYNLMFKNDTGIIILNGDNGKEGIIEKVNSEFEKIFKYNYNELKEKNISILMPKIFASQHHEFMQNFINIGERTIICTKEYSTFGKDKNNSIIFIKLYIKIFPILNNSVYFIGMIVPEKLDDLIFIDSNFIIQGMSKKIQDTLKLKNKLFFTENDIPFYMICKNFINFYKIFMKGNKKEIIDENNVTEESEDFSQTYIYEKEELKIEEEQIENNIEINENIELEYEIKIPNFMMEFQKSTKKGLVLENVAPETIIVEKSNLIDNTRISTNFIINEKQESLISKEENKSNRNNEDNHLGFNLNRINSTINNNDYKYINNNNRNNEIYKNNSKENNNNEI